MQVCSSIGYHGDSLLMSSGCHMNFIHPLPHPTPLKKKVCIVVHMYLVDGRMHKEILRLITSQYSNQGWRLALFWLLITSEVSCLFGDTQASQDFVAFGTVQEAWPALAPSASSSSSSVFSFSSSCTSHCMYVVVCAS